MKSTSAEDRDGSSSAILGERVDQKPYKWSRPSKSGTGQPHNYIQRCHGAVGPQIIVSGPSHSRVLTAAQIVFRPLTASLWRGTKRVFCGRVELSPRVPKMEPEGGKDSSARRLPDCRVFFIPPRGFPIFDHNDEAGCDGPPICHF